MTAALSGTAAQPAPAAAECRHKLVLAVEDARLAGRIAAALQELIEPPADAVSAFERPAHADARGWTVEAYYLDEPDAVQVASALADLLGISVPSIAIEPVPAENWVVVSQAALPPVAAGRFTVHGSHDRERVPRGPNAILIDAGEAFGTAHHATTSGCLIAIDRLARTRRPRRVLDLGCGTGVLAIAAARALPRALVTASDIDPVAVAVAAANVRRNGAAAIEVKVAGGVPRPRRRHVPPWDLVIANILARPLIALAPKVSRAVAPGGALVLSGLLEAQAREVLAAYRGRGFRLLGCSRIAGWATLSLEKAGSLAKRGQ